MKHDPPRPPTLGSHGGLAYAAFEPDGEPEGAVVILHGAGSSKESHFDFARVCRDRGLAAIAYDARGHGASDGRFGPDALHDVAAICALARELAPTVALRGSSLGGCCAILAAATTVDVAAVVAICPAPPQNLRDGLAREEPEGFEVDREATLAWLDTLDIDAAVAGLGPGTALLLLHAAGDERVDVADSERLAGLAGEPKRLIVFPGGDHRSLQHDLEVQNLAVNFVQRSLRGPA